jgi:hypothetical protein
VPGCGGDCLLLPALPGCCDPARLMQVDIDLSKEGDAAQVSRQQARLHLRNDGCFCITNTGRRKLTVNGCQVCTPEWPQSLCSCPDLRSGI